MMRRVSIFALLVASLALAPPVAHASFHLMQMEQAIGGVDGDTSAQAIQLRMRSGGQNVLSLCRVSVVDATGANPIVIADPATNLPSGTLGDHVLLATASFAAHTTPAAVPDFVITTPIPASYLAAGSLRFEDNLGNTVYWRLSWGGPAYTGPHNGSTLNDADGNFGPAYLDPLPSTSNEALRFQGLASAQSLNNDADYMVTSGGAVFVNWAGSSFAVDAATGAPEVSRAGVVLGDPVVAPNPFRSSTRVEFQLARPAQARLVIVDALGRRLGEVARSFPAGTSSLEWNGRDSAGHPLPTGVYFYRLEVADATRTGQLLLLR